MYDSFLSVVKDKISTLHEGDEKQLEVIFSDAKRIIVEAPAGYGKTTTMVSRIAYLYATAQIPNPKKALGLTFSVNAALKIKRDIAAKLPALLNQTNNPMILSDKIAVTNYHGFCKAVLGKYGYLISDLLKKDINLFYAMGDEAIPKNEQISNILSNEEMLYLQKIDEKIKSSQMPSDDEVLEYNSIVVKKMLPHDYITHNAIVLFAIELFHSNHKISQFYTNYYPLIIVDEFQDTNCIAWELLKSIIGENTKLLFLGDPLQRIYGFIGAMPSLMEDATKYYSMEKITLNKNYRFRNNMQMLLLDSNIRANAYHQFSKDDYEKAQIPAFWAKDQETESDMVKTKILSIMVDSPNSKIAILLRSRNESVGIIEQSLEYSRVDYFYGMFTDEDAEYIRFHDYCQSILIHSFGKKRYINSRSLDRFVEQVKAGFAAKDNKMADSLNKLLRALIDKISVDYNELQPEEKYELLLDIFENRQLKQAMEYVDSPVILSTVHGAKGLEWDYVFIVDLEIWGMPSYFTCIDCPNKFDRANSSKCLFPNVSDNSFREKMLDELSVFYVATTRARKQVFFSASQVRANGKSGKYSCFVSLPGIKLVNAAE